MSRIAKTFAACKAENRAALITYVMAGDPDLATTAEILDALVEAGADIIELGVPFSDPMADGPTIQAAANRALKHDNSVDDILALVKDFRTRHADTPIILMGYYNRILHYGVENFCKAASDAGVDGLITVDITPEEQGEFIPHTKAHDIAHIVLAAPTTTAARAKTLLKDASGFVYYISVTGVTGAGSSDASDVGKHVAMLRAETDLPIAIGFGIKNAEQAKQFAGEADGVVVGSSIVRIIEDNQSDKRSILSNLLSFVGALAAAMRR